MKIKAAKLAVCVSGGGRSLENLIALVEHVPWTVVAVVSSSQTCKANEIARKHRIPLFIGDFSRAQSEDTARRLSLFLTENHVDWIVLAGFLKLFPTLKDFKDSTVNIHPALLPRHGGKGMHGSHVHEAVLAAGDVTSGATVHFVNEHYDDGALISRWILPVKKDDTALSLAQRVFRAECQLLPKTLTGLVMGTLPLAGGLIKEWKDNEI